MVDSLSPDERSRRMAKIRGKNTRPELILRSALHRLGLRYRLHSSRLPGRPDLVFTKYRAVIFVHGCFWHHHEGCSIGTTPKSNTEFWVEKFKRNTARDMQVEHALNALGWRIFIVWECELRSINLIEAVTLRIASQLKSGVL